MKIFGSLGAAIGKRTLRRKEKKLLRKRSFVNLSLAKEIGIIWDIQNPSDFDKIAQFIQRLSAKTINVSVLGFFHEKKLPDNLTAIRFLSCVKKDEVSWTGKPTTQEATEFIGKPFDVLIEISFRDYLPLRYAAAVNTAKLKVAPLSKKVREQGHSDMLIEVQSSKNIEEYLTQTLHYLEMINHKN